MRILHEGLPEEASVVAQALKDVFGIETDISEDSFDGVFAPIPEFDGFDYSYYEVISAISSRGINASKQAVLVLTPRDLYMDKQSKDDDWIFGYAIRGLSLVTNARMKRYDNSPSDSLEVPPELYHKRIAVLAVHEVGHDVAKAPHHKFASWVNSKTGHSLNLGPHCTDNGCAMYEIVDIKAPPESEGYMLLGEEKRYDAGLDDVLERLKPGWFCGQCRSAIRIDEKYK